jgi:hypothetical protein
MSIARFGRIVPIQGAMLELIGWHLGRGKSTIISQDNKRVEVMRRGRRRLVWLTGQDFKYDLDRWRRYLLTSKSGYRHPYAFEVVDPAVRAAISDPTFKRVAILAAEGEPESLVEKIDAERKAQESQRTEEIQRRAYSPWGAAICENCGARKSMWADSAKGICGQCGEPLGPEPHLAKNDEIEEL